MSYMGVVLTDKGVLTDKARMGAESTLRRARTFLWWPSMNNQLKQFIATCEVCNAFQTKNHKETLMSQEIPNRP